MTYSPLSPQNNKNQNCANTIANENFLPIAKKDDLPVSHYDKTFSSTLKNWQCFKIIQWADRIAKFECQWR
jgi:hypothetical protein